MRSDQMGLFVAPLRPRAKPRKLARMIDCGEGPGDATAEFRCPRCGWESGWIAASDGEIRRGIPCEPCNATTDGGTDGH